MKKRMTLFAGLACSVATPALASQGIDCTIGGEGADQRHISLMAGTMPAPRWEAVEKIGEEWVELEVGMHWVDDERLLIQFVGKDGFSSAGTIRARFDGKWGWDGTYIFNDVEQQVRCDLG